MANFIDGMAKRRAYQRAYNTAYYAAHREAILAANKQRRGRTKSRGLQSLDYREMALRLLLQRDGDLCCQCGSPMSFDDISISHIEQRAFGGTNEAENLRLAHWSCHRHAPKRARTHRGADLTSRRKYGEGLY